MAHDADWLKSQLDAERARLAETQPNPRPWAEYAIITRESVRRYAAKRALEAPRRERQQALALARESLDATKRTYWPSMVAAWASVIAAIAGIAGLGITLLKP